MESATDSIKKRHEPTATVIWVAINSKLSQVPWVLALTAEKVHFKSWHLALNIFTDQGDKSKYGSEIAHIANAILLQTRSDPYRKSNLRQAPREHVNKPLLWICDRIGPFLHILTWNTQSTWNLCRYMSPSWDKANQPCWLRCQADMTLTSSPRFLFTVGDHWAVCCGFS